MKAIFLVTFIWALNANSLDSEICIHGSIKPDKFDCTKFFICIYEKWRKTACPDKTYFSIYHNFCVPNKSVCANSPATTTTDFSTSISTPQPNCTIGDLKPDPDNCINFFMCFKCLWILMSCPIGSYFNLDERFCTTDNKQSCIDDRIITTKIPNCREGHLRPNPDNCAQFFICLRNNWKLAKCKVNMYFSQKDNYCIWNDGSCLDIQTTKNPIKCRPGALMADNLNCAKYFICLRGDWKILACPMSMYFDIKYEMCLPDYGKCFK